MSDSSPLKTLYLASPFDQLNSCGTDARCMIVAHDDPIAAVLHYRYAPLCTLFVIEWCCEFKQVDMAATKYTYTGPGREFNVLQKIKLSPTNYLQDWYLMNRMVNYVV